MNYEQIIRGQIAAERIERIADACAKANGERRAPRKARRYLLPPAGLEPTGSARSVRPELQG